MKKGIIILSLMLVTGLVVLGKGKPQKQATFKVQFLGKYLCGDSFYFVDADPSGFQPSKGKRPLDAFVAYDSTTGTLTYHEKSYEGSSIARLTGINRITKNGMESVWSVYIHLGPYDPRHISAADRIHVPESTSAIWNSDEEEWTIHYNNALAKIKMNGVSETVHVTFIMTIHPI